MRTISGSSVVLSACVLVIGCGGSDNNSGTQPSQNLGGTGNIGGFSGSATGGAHQTSATSSVGGLATGGRQGTGGTTASSSATSIPATGGAMTTGGTPATGGAKATGGSPTTGGAKATGGSPTTGGVAATGGSLATGGTANPGGSGATGGGSAGGASAAGGKTANGGSQTAGGTRAAGGTSSSVAGSTSAGGTSAAVASSGCNKTPTLTNSTNNASARAITINVSGTSRQYAIRWPSDYDKTHPYRLILDLHGYGGTYQETAGEDYFGLWSVSNNTTIFIALSAISTDWRTGDNLAYVDAVLKAVQDDLCIDTSRVMLEGFSQGAAMTWTLACSRPGVFRAVVGHSGGGVTNPTKCDPIPYLGSGGLQESVTQTTQSDQFAKWNGCTVTQLPTAPTGGHVCTNYTGCPTADPVRWCNYDGPHTPLPTDKGSSKSWMPSETWPFFSQF